jgi:L-arabinose 1-dehydrogenase [NAD(P)+]
MTEIAITGAAGDVGREAVEAFEDSELSLFTHSESEDLDSAVLDVMEEASFADALSGVDADVLIHLAWNPTESDDWTGGHEANVRGVYNAYEAARRNGIDRVVFASSNHAIGMYNREDPANQESMVADPTEIVSPDRLSRPDSYYGVAKVASEAMGSYYADRYGIEVVNLRIGWLMPAAELRTTHAESAPDRARFARAMWLSPRDWRHLVRAAATAPLAVSPLTLNAISRNDERFLTLTETAFQLDYRPRDNAAEALE